MDPIHKLLLAIGAGLDKLANFAVLTCISVLLLLVLMAWINPAAHPANYALAKFASYLWAISKIIMGAVLGEAFYRASRRGHTSSDDALEQSMAETRRITLMAASIIAVGLLS
jgi:hypothetical protein